LFKALRLYTHRFAVTARMRPAIIIRPIGGYAYGKINEGGVSIYLGGNYWQGTGIDRVPGLCPLAAVQLSYQTEVEG
jgi:hypothetical protein